MIRKLIAMLRRPKIAPAPPKLPAFIIAHQLAQDAGAFTPYHSLPKHGSSRRE